MMVKRETGAHGRAVMAWLDAEFERLGVAPVTWARTHGLTPTNFGKWRDGVSDPSLNSLEEIADALGRSTLALLIAAGYVDANEISGDLAHSSIPNIVDAIERDPSLDPRERTILRNALDLARQAGEIPPGGRRRRQV